MSTFSIIMPVYNGEAFVEESIQTVLSNMHGEDEFIIVNDGSVDATEELCKKYVSENVHLYTKQNEGASVARNYGVAHATKDYILFIDSDDLLCDGIMDVLHAMDFKGCDFVVGKDMIHFDSNTRKETLYHNLKKFELTGREATITNFIAAEDNLGIWAVWRHLFRREFIVNEAIRFDASYSYAEDMDFIMNALLKAKSFGMIDKPLVKYRQYSGSVSGQYSLKSMKSHISVLYKWQNYFYNSDFSKENKKRILRKLANKQIAVMAHVNHLVSSQRNDFFDLFALSAKYLKYSSGKFKYVYRISRIVGYEKVSRLLGGKR